MCQVDTKCLLYIYYVQVEILYKLQLQQISCTSCNLYRLTCTSCNMYNFSDLYKLHLVQAPNLSDEQCILMN